MDVENTEMKLLKFTVFQFYMIDWESSSETPMKRKFHDFLTVLMSTEKLLNQTGFELALSGNIV